MIETRPDGDGMVYATFCLEYGEGQHDVSVVGEFNGWSHTANPMHYDGHGYTAELVVASGREYRFRYLIDGDRWQNDWAADSYAPNEYGGDDSVLDLTGARASRVLSRPLLSATSHEPARFGLSSASATSDP